MKKVTERLKFLGMLSLVLGATSIAKADLITNGSFEEGTFTPNISLDEPGKTGGMKLYNGDTSITGWRVMNQSGGDIVWALNSDEPQGNPWKLKASDGKMFLDLTGYANNFNFPKGGIQLAQTAATQNGQYYKLTFDVGSSSSFDNLNPVVQVSVNGNPASHTFIGNVSLPDNLPFENHWQTVEFTFKAFGPSTISFTAWTPGVDRAILLDNVRLTAVPEPATVLAGALLLLPLGVSSLRIFAARASDN
jgi:hypothetical protein